MTNPKEPGGWQDAGTVPDQPKGTKDRTFGSREAFPRDVDEGMGRHPKPETDGRTIRSPRANS
jgi:hypothetical protein